MYHRVTPTIREAIRFRYRLTPYLYSAEYEASQTGIPIMRALVCEFQEDPNVYDESFTFLFGRDLLVANVLEKGEKTKRHKPSCPPIHFIFNVLFHIINLSLSFVIHHLGRRLL